ncbi:hypothetical protein AAE478_008439 [Parahypoxylon ruwenzoriense]
MPALFDSARVGVLAWNTRKRRIVTGTALLALVAVFQSFTRCSLKAQLGWKLPPPPLEIPASAEHTHELLDL